MCNHDHIYCKIRLILTDTVLCIDKIKYFKNMKGQHQSSLVFFNSFGMFIMLLSSYHYQLIRFPNVFKYLVFLKSFIALQIQRNLIPQNGCDDVPACVCSTALGGSATQGESLTRQDWLYWAEGGMQSCWGKGWASSFSFSLN